MARGDPVETIIANALDSCGIKFTRECDGKVNGQTLDFYIPSMDLYIEVCAYYTPRKIRQMELASNVILVQGKEAAKHFAQMISKRLDT